MRPPILNVRVAARVIRIERRAEDPVERGLPDVEIIRIGRSQRGARLFELGSGRVALLATRAGLANALRMMRLPDLRPSAAVEGRAWREGDQRATGSASSSARARTLAAWSAAETSGQRRSSALSFWTSTAATSAWVSHLWSAGMTYQGAQGVEVA